MADESPAKQTFDSFKQTMSLVFKWAYMNDIILSNPMEKVDVKASPDMVFAEKKRRKTKQLSDEKRKIWLHWAQIRYPMYYDYAIYMFSAGNRAGEASALKMDSI
jgi:integrase